MCQIDQCCFISTYVCTYSRNMFFVYIFLYPAVMANVNERENLNEFTLAGSAFP